MLAGRMGKVNAGAPGRILDRQEVATQDFFGRMLLVSDHLDPKFVTFDCYGTLTWL
jgi:hypothetical protein